MVTTTSTQNPITALRRQLGMSRADLALVTGLSYQTLRNAEQGYTQHINHICDAFADAGFDGDILARDYVDWRTDRTRTLRAELHTGRIEQEETASR